MSILEMLGITLFYRSKKIYQIFSNRSLAHFLPICDHSKSTYPSKDHKRACKACHTMQRFSSSASEATRSFFLQPRSRRRYLYLLFSFFDSLLLGKWPLDPIVSASDFTLRFPILPKDDAFDLMFSEIASDLFSGSKRTVNDLFSMRY